MDAIKDGMLATAKAAEAAARLGESLFGGKQKFNSQICTTKEQSERLLALGLKKETADMVWTHAYYATWVATASKNPLYEEGESIPAWSLHRLLELNLLCCEQHFAFQFHITNIDNAYEYLINHTEWLIKTGYFNKDYLI